MSISIFFSELIKLENHSRIFDCRLENLKLIRKSKRGSISSITLQCNICQFVGVIQTENSDIKLDINTSIIQGMTCIGSGFQNMKELFGCLNIPTMTATSYGNIQNNVSILFEQNALNEMHKAAEEEKELAVAAGDVSPDSVPEIIVMYVGEEIV